MSSRDGFDQVLRIVQTEMLEREDGAAGRQPVHPAPPRRPFVRCPDLFSLDSFTEDSSWSITTAGGSLVDPPSQDAVLRALRVEVGRIRDAAVQGNPLSNTGFKFTAHGAAASVYSPVDEVMEVLCSSYLAGYHFDSDWREFFVLVGSANFYEQRWVGPNGITVKTGFKNGPDHVSIELAGETFDVFGMEPFGRLLATIHERGVRWYLTRLDLAFDGVPFTPRQVYQALCRGQFRSDATRETIVQHDTPFGESAGRTVNLGKRGSADYLRVYDRRETGTRIEHECRKHRAKLAGLCLAMTPMDKWHNLALIFLRDFIDFVRVRPGDNVSRCPVISWWGQFIGEVERLKISVAGCLAAFRRQAEETVVKLVSMAKAVHRRLFVLHGILGEVGTRELFASLHVRIRPDEHVRVAAYREVLSRYVDAWGSESDKVFSAMLPPGSQFRLAECLAREYNNCNACSG